MILFITLIVLIAYFLGHSYFVQLQIHKNKAISIIEAVSKTAAVQLDANQLDYLLNKHPKKNSIRTNKQDQVYLMLHESLKSIKELNTLSTDLYTLTLDSLNNRFFFGVTSSENPFIVMSTKTFLKSFIITT